MIISKEEAIHLLDTKAPLSSAQARVCELLANGYDSIDSISKRLGQPQNDVYDTLRDIDNEFGEYLAV